MRRCRSPIAIDFGEQRVKVLQLQRIGERLAVAAAATARVEPPADGQRPAAPAASRAAAAPTPTAPAPAPKGAAAVAAAASDADRVRGDRRARQLAACKRALRAAPFRGDTARIALGLDAISTRHLRIAHDQLEHANDRIAAKIAEPPAPATEVAICPLAVSDLYEHGERMREFLCCIAPQPEIEALLSLCAGTGLRADGIDLEPLAQSRAQLRAHTADSFVHVDLGAAAARVTIVRSGEPVLMRSVAVGGERLRALLESQLQLDVAAIAGLADGDGDATVARAVVDTLAQSLEPLVRCVADGIRYCGTLFHGRTANALRTTGQCAALPGLVRYLERRVGIGAEQIDLFAGIDCPTIPPRRRDDYATALGLALGGMPQ